jgi:hypothetical protein
MPGDDKSLPDILHAAQGGDNSPEMMMFDLPNLFDVQQRPGAPTRPRARTGKMTIDLNCVSFSKVFTLWRPWQSCDRCRLAIAEEKVTLPEKGEYLCPHVQEDEYKAVKDTCLRGEAVLQKEDFFNIRSDDSRCVHILWWCVDPISMEKLKKQQTVDAVYPPNPDAVFAKGEAEDRAKATKKTRGVSKDSPTR